ncbi:DUF1698 domain-containing protein [bacterium]|nr:DUF1698 domain-containing protein [bacterium]
MNKKDKRKLVDSYKGWWHSIKLGDGIISKGRIPTHEHVKCWKIPEDYFNGKTVLDIGAWDGFYSFHAEALGAKSVTAIDKVIWGMSEKNISSKKGFDIAKKCLNSNVSGILMDLMDATPKNLGKFDVILCAGVLYHLEHPYLALSIIKNLLNDHGKLLIESHCDTTIDTDKPVMVYYPNDELAGDISNWWGPNPKCLLMMLEKTGFTVTKYFEDYTNLSRFIFYCEVP